MMSWVYEVTTGRMYDDSGTLVGVGYSGAPGFKNDASQQAVPDKGPLPSGTYTINSPVDTEKHGPFVMWLTPDPKNEMFGRSAFGIHGDSVKAPGTASEGCVILSRDVRQAIWDSNDHTLKVVTSLETEES